MIDETKEQGPVGEQQTTEAPADLSDVETITGEDSTPESEAETLQRQLDESRDQLMRIAAEFENYKKRMERERGKLLKYAGENILRDLLTTLDNLDRAVEQGNAEAEDDSKKLEAMLQGIELTRKGLVATMERYGVEPLAAIGLSFNPDEHDALTMEASDEVPANHVLREFAKGYRFKDRVLRHAQVVVSSGPGKAA
ncbi:GrpE protein [Desulfobulbus propionicus DSM 2032]|uniref:Protein GrpE n=1 Tax=Desulfobulbus propionicus (strain ATCC 33891 / DSM 2032 / VKM B-1956 / 1pr3) TaxID=577650 RepID=A0A7U4DNN0_DESPD|nr:nucleotide exchange factor GrpE [Desulfobulbus propionicus]ADW17097.1 GrpE protein [Desulfobulbus propionicus DSM 2032]